MNYQTNNHTTDINYIPEQSKETTSDDYSGEENNPNKANRSRKHEREVSEWKRTQAKINKNRGKEDFNRKNEEVHARTVKETDCSKYKLKCSE